MPQKFLVLRRQSTKWLDMPNILGVWPLGYACGTGRFLGWDCIINVSPPHCGSWCEAERASNIIEKLRKNQVATVIWVKISITSRRPANICTILLCLHNFWVTVILPCCPFGFLHQLPSSEMYCARNKNIFQWRFPAFLNWEQTNI